MSGDERVRSVRLDESSSASALRWYAPSSSTGSDRGSLVTTTMVLLTLWMATTALVALPAVTWDAIASTPLVFYFTIGSFVVFVIGLNVAPVILVLGVVAIFRSRGRRVLRAAFFAAVIAIGAVWPFVMLGWSTGDNDSEVTDLRPNLPVRGLAMWASAAVTVFLASRLLRTPVFRRRDGLPGRWRRERLIALTLVVVVGVAGLETLLSYVTRPVVTVKNDTTRTLTVQICPDEQCTGAVHFLKPGATRRLRLELHKGDATTDSLQVSTGGEVFGCLVIGQLPGLARDHLNLSDADPAMC
jgi:hypothetical protein